MKSFALRSAATPLFLAGFIAASLVFASVGCGSGGGTSPAPGVPSGLAAAALYSGKTYTSQVSLANGQNGNLSMSVSGTTASGTLEIVDPSRGVSAKTRIVISTPFLSGTFDPLTGAINLTGSYTVNGRTIPISMTGTLPVPPATTGGGVTITIDGKSYTTTFGGVGASPSPNPSGSASPNPTPSAGPTASPSPTPSPSPGSGKIEFEVISKDENCNFAYTDFASLKQGEAFYVDGGGGGYTFVGPFAATGKNYASFLVGYTVYKTQNGFAPETFTIPPVLTAGTNPDNFVAYGKTFITVSTSSGSLPGVWTPRGGTLTLESVNGKSVTFRGDNVKFSPINGSSTGNFIANFRVTFDNVEKR